MIDHFVGGNTESVRTNFSSLDGGGSVTPFCRPCCSPSLHFTFLCLDTRFVLGTTVLILRQFLNPWGVLLCVTATNDQYYSAKSRVQFVDA